MYKGIFFLIKSKIHGCTAQRFVAYGNMGGHTEAIFEFQPLPPDMTLEKVIFAKFFTLQKSNIILYNSGLGLKFRNRFGQATLITKYYQLFIHMTTYFIGKCVKNSLVRIYSILALYFVLVCT